MKPPMQLLFQEFPHNDVDSGLTADDFADFVEIDSFIAPLDAGNPPAEYCQAVKKALRGLMKLHKKSQPGSRTENCLQRLLENCQELQEYYRRGFIRRPK